MQLQGRVDELKKQGLGLAAISYDSQAITADFSKRMGITLPLLSDPGSETIKKYGIFNTTVDPTSTNYGIPFPGTFMLDRRGVVTARFFEHGHQERNTVSTMLLTLGVNGSMVAGVRHRTDHLELTTHVSDDTVSPGQIFSIVLDVKPRPRMHVYAPGAQNYKVIALNLEPNPLLNVRPVQFPPSEIYHFVPLNERVPVYQQPFRLVQEVNLEISNEAQKQIASMTSVTVKGTVDYQACDDKICYNPVSVPVSWTLKVRPLDRQRANVPR